MLAAGLVILLLLQYRTLPKLTPLPAAYWNFDHFLKDFTATVRLTAEDYLLAASLVIVFGFLLVLEWRRLSLTRLLVWVFATENRTWLALMILTATWIRFYWVEGSGRWIGDSTAHLAYLIAAAHTIKSFELPVWSNLIGVGTPYLQYYGFLYFYFAGAIDLILRDIHLTTKLSLWLGHMVSAATMYLFARQLMNSRPAAFMAALAYVASFWHTQQVLLMGRYPLSLFYALLPVPFYVFERFVNGEKHYYLVGIGGIALGALSMIHPGYGFWATFFLLLYVALRLATESRNRQATLRLSILMTTTGILFGAYLTLGMFLEQDGTGLQAGIDLANVPDPSWKRVFLWSNLYFPMVPLKLEEAAWYGGYLGMSLLGLVAVGAWCLMRRPRAAVSIGLPIFACLAITFLLVFGYRLSLLQAIPFVTALNAGRYLLFVVFFLAICAGFGSRELIAFRSQRSRRWGKLTIPLLVVVADLGPTTLQQPFAVVSGVLIKDSEVLLEQLEEQERSTPIPVNQLQDERLFLNLGTMHPFIAPTWLLKCTGWPIPQAEHRRILPSMMVFVSPFERYLSRVMHFMDDPEVVSAIRRSNVVIGGLHMLNVRKLMAVQKDYAGSRVFEWKRASPILVSNRLEPRAELNQVTPPEEFIDWSLDRFSDRDPLQILQEVFPVAEYIAATEVHGPTNSCKQIFVSDLEVMRDLGTKPVAMVHDHRVWDQRVEIDVGVSEACFARLSYAYFPSLTIRVNGEEVKAMKTSAGFVMVPLAAGDNSIEIEAKLSMLRRILFGLDVALVIGTVWLWWRERRQLPTNSPSEQNSE